MIQPTVGGLGVWLTATAALIGAARPGRFLAEMEMKLHLAAEDASLYLQDHSTRALTRIPAATKELLRIKVRAAERPRGLSTCWGRGGGR